MTPEAEPRVAIIGSGVMGAGIAQVFAAGGSAVTLFDPSADALTAALERIRTGVGQLGCDADEVLARIETRSELAAAAADAQLVVEAGPESLVVKQEIFEALGEVAPAAAVLASNTSAIPIGQMSEPRPTSSPCEGCSPGRRSSGTARS